MFNSVKYIEFENKAPKSLQKLVEGCSAFNLQIPIDSNWKKSKRRVLFVTNHVTSNDLKNRKLLSSESKTLLNNCIEQAEKILTPYVKEIKDYAVAAINFNFFRNYHLKGELAKKADEIQAQRVKNFIEKVKPTHVFICGAKPSYLLLKDLVDKPLHKMGWVNKLKINGHKCLVTSSVDFTLALEDGKTQDVKLNEDSDDETQLVGVYQLSFMCRNLACLLNDSNPWAIQDCKVKPYFVDTIKKFDKMMKVLYKHDKIAVDTETANLNKVANTLLIVQFSVDKDLGYVLPVHHKDTPFTIKQLSYIRKKLREFFLQKMEHTLDKYLIFYNAKFDVTVLRQALGLPFIYWPIYDCMSGEHALDETMSLLHNVVKFDKTKVKFGNLAQVACTYEQDFYYNHTFAKTERANIVSESLSKPIIEYASYDTQIIYAMHDKQLLRAKKTVHREKGKDISYLEDFKKIVIYQHSNNNHCYSEMEHAGTYCDVKYLLSLQSEDSPVSQQIKNSLKAIYETKYVKKANNILLKEKGVDPKKTVFKAPFVFTLTGKGNKEHKELLFFKVLKLKPVDFGKKSGKPSLGKKFKEYHKDNAVVKLFNALEKANKIKSTYVTAFIKALNKKDGKDGYLRAMFGFFDVLTGRANSSKPSFQQIPEHGPKDKTQLNLAKLIKRIFIAPKGHLIIKLDYSAHEVRCWSIASFDEVLAEVFRVGRNLRKKLYKTGNIKLLKDIFYKGDVHKINAAFFFAVAIEAVDKILRQATKAVAFGAIYGKSIKSMARDLDRPLEFVKNLYANFFGRFKNAAKWLQWAKDFSAKHLFVYSPIGRRRNLIGYLVPKDNVVASMQRRAQNAPIQGFGSDIVHTAGRLFTQHIYEYLLKIGEIDKDTEQMPIRLNRMVHDSIFTSAPFHLVLATVQIIQWCCIKGTEKFYDEKFNVRFLVPLEIEIELGASTDKTYKWDWSVIKYDEKHYIKKLGKDYKQKYDIDSYPIEECIRLACEDYCKLYTGNDSKALYKKVMSSWNDSKVKKYLDKNYPILPEGNYDADNKRAA